MKIKYLFICLVLPVSAWQPPTVAVLDFPVADNAVVLGEGYRGDTWIGRDDLLSHDVVRVLKRSGKFRVLEPTNLKEVKQARLRLVKALESGRKPGGELLAARYLVFGNIESVEASLEEKPIPGSQRHTYTHGLGRIRIHMRVSDTLEGRIVAADSFTVECETSLPLALKFIEELKHEAVIRVVNRIVDTIYPMRIADIQEQTIAISRGEDGVLRIGDEIEIFQEGDEIRDPETGKTLGHRESLLCTAQITDISPGYSLARFESKCLNLSVGMLCRVK